MFSYRICQDQTIVNRLPSPGYIPTDTEKRAAEDCFEAGALDCVDVTGQTCGFSADCTEGEACWRNDWFTCNGFYADYKGYHGVDNSALVSCYTSISGGYTVTKKVNIPNYNPFQTSQVDLTCADIAISGSGSGSSSSSIGSTLSTSTSTSTKSTSNTSSASSCATASSVVVIFNELKTTTYGQTIKIAESISELGNWDTGSAPALSASAYTAASPLWSYTASLAAGESFTYKFILIDPNRAYTVLIGCATTVVADDMWRRKGEDA
ncbi:starch-binding domain-like protein [Acephala macrosclerotiorum]|nr:starch-binding domain-like protein [Acephala macrosclerotiorum]